MLPIISTSSSFAQCVFSLLHQRESLHHIRKYRFCHFISYYDVIWKESSLCYHMIRDHRTFLQQLFIIGFVTRTPYSGWNRACQAYNYYSFHYFLHFHIPPTTIDPSAYCSLKEGCVIVLFGTLGSHNLLYLILTKSNKIDSAQQKQLQQPPERGVMAMRSTL